MCSSPHLWFLHAKQRILDQNFKSLWVPALICGFWMPNSEFWPRITSLYGSQTSPALVCNQNGVICTRISSLYWFQPSSVVLCLQNSDFRTRLTSLYGSQTSSVDLCNQNRRHYNQNYMSVWVPAFIRCFVLSTQRAYHKTYKSLWVLACGFVNAKQCA